MTTYVNTYSFLDVQVAIAGPGGSFSIGGGEEGGVADEGVTISYDGDKGTLIAGADGTPMHSLHAANIGHVTIRLLKTSPINQLLNAMYRFEVSSAANYGQDIITVRNPSRGDAIVCAQSGWRKHADITNAKEGGTMEWTWNVGVIGPILGSGVPSLPF